MINLDRCDAIVDTYLNELRGQFSSTRSENRCLITTPFVRSDGEAIELSVEVAPTGMIRVGDMGDTLGYLYVNGLTLSRSVVDSASRISRSFGTSLQRGQIVVQVQNTEQLGQALQGVLQSVLAVSDLIQKRRTSEQANFDAEVESAIISTGNVYDTDYTIRGRISPHKLRFHINSSRRLLIQPLSAASETGAFGWAERWAYRFNDILQMDSGWRCLAVLDDRGGRSKVWSDRASQPLSSYAVLWSERVKMEDLLTQHS